MLFIRSNTKQNILKTTFYYLLGSNRSNVVISSWRRGQGFNLNRFRLRAKQQGELRPSMLCESVECLLIIITGITHGSILIFYLKRVESLLIIITGISHGSILIFCFKRVECLLIIITGISHVSIITFYLKRVESLLIIITGISHVSILIFCVKRVGSLLIIIP